MNVRVKKGELYVIHWLDAAGYMMEDLVKAKPCLCKTVGWVMKIEKDHIVLASSYYPDDKDEHGDFCVLPKGMVTRVSLIKHEDQ